MEDSIGKTFDVINSCTTKEQLKVAGVYVFLYTRKLQRYCDRYNLVYEVFNEKTFELDQSIYKTIGIVQ